MGRITCCNVLSDMFAMGVTQIDNMLLLLGVPTSMKLEERMTVNKLIMEGFRDCAAEAGTLIRGGQTVQNPWLMIGGVATSVCSPGEYIMPDQVKPGDKLVLTKPLGTQVAVNCHQWMLDDHLVWSEKLKPAGIREEFLRSLYDQAVHSMARLNVNGARLMHKYHANGCTDVTGFGIVGHAQNLLNVQKRKHLSFHIDRLPLMKGVQQLSNLLEDRFGVFQGLAPETSGGLLIALPGKAAQDFCQEVKSLDKSDAWIVGSVVESQSSQVVLAQNLEILEV